MQEIVLQKSVSHCSSLVCESVEPCHAAWQHYRYDVETPQSADRKLLRWWNHVQLIRCGALQLWRALKSLQNIESKKSRQLYIRAGFLPSTTVVMILQIITFEMILHCIMTSSRQLHSTLLLFFPCFFLFSGAAFCFLFLFPVLLRWKKTTCWGHKMRGEFHDPPKKQGWTCWTIQQFSKTKA